MREEEDAAPFIRDKKPADILFNDKKGGVEVYISD